MKTITLLTIAIATSFLADGVMAEDRSTPQLFARGQFLERAREKLALTDEQFAEMKSVFRPEKDNITRLLMRMRNARAELREAIRATDANETAVRAAAAKVAAVEGDVAVERMKLFRQISPILIEEQRVKLNKPKSRLHGNDAISGEGERLSE